MSRLTALGRQHTNGPGNHTARLGGNRAEFLDTNPPVRFHPAMFKTNHNVRPQYRRQFFEMTTKATPDQSPEPTAVGAVSSAVAVHAASRRWLSFFR
jgi:hypothetical protein